MKNENKCACVFFDGIQHPKYRLRKLHNNIHLRLQIRHVTQCKGFDDINDAMLLQLYLGK